MSVRPYGDREGDGKMQVSFALPMTAGPLAKEAARGLLSAQGYDEVAVASVEPIDAAHAFVIAYVRTNLSVDPKALKVPVVDVPDLDFFEINALIESKVKRPLKVIGACIGSDAHTVGIDAIMNMKGFAGDYGLERYPWFDAKNLGAQIDMPDLVEWVKRWHPDAVLVSQVVTQQNIHVENARSLIELLNSAGLRTQVILILGGPRIDHRLALDLGYDGGFGTGTMPHQVASFIGHTWLRKQGGQQA